MKEECLTKVKEECFESFRHECTTETSEQCKDVQQKVCHDPVLKINNHATGGWRTKDILGGPKSLETKKLGSSKG